MSLPPMDAKENDMNKTPIVKELGIPSLFTTNNKVQTLPFLVLY